MVPKRFHKHSESKEILYCDQMQLNMQRFKVSKCRKPTMLFFFFLLETKVMIVAKWLNLQSIGNQLTSRFREHQYWFDYIVKSCKSCCIK